MLTRADVPQIAAQPTAQGRKINIGDVLDDGRLPIGYGDYGANTGYIDLLAVDPTGAWGVLFSQMDTEQISVIKRLNYDWHYVPAIDPKNNGAGAIVTNNPDGEWKSWWVQSAGYENPAHLFDMGYDGRGGFLLTCGSTWGGDAGESTVWSTSDGVEWTVEHRGGQGRFYEFKYVNGAPAVQLNYAGPWFVRQTDGTWVDAGNPTFDERPQFPAHTWVDSQGRLRHSVRGVIGTLPPTPEGWAWETRAASDGGIWLNNGRDIYHLPYYA